MTKSETLSAWYWIPRDQPACYESGNPDNHDLGCQFWSQSDREPGRYWHEQKEKN